MSQDTGKILGPELSRQRESKKMTQAQVAEGCGICLRYYQKLEKGAVNNPGLKTALQLANVLDISLDSMVPSVCD